MKALYCQVCGDIIAPNREKLKPRWCRCGRHAVWWIDPAAGVLRVHDKFGGAANAYVLGFHNQFLHFSGTHTAVTMQRIVDATPNNYLFAQQGSVVVRFRPGETDDTAWATELPQEKQADE